MKWVLVNHTCFWRSTLFGGRAALQVDRAVRHERDAVGGSHELVVHLQVRVADRLLHVLDDARADVHGVAHGLLLVVVVRERNRRIPVTDRDRAGVLDLLQRAVLGDRGGEGQGAGGRAEGGLHEAQHWDSFVVWKLARVE
jgi:hypothetical protein